jgi:hypothetical protein
MKPSKDVILTAVAAGAAFVSAIFWLTASLLPVRDNLDVFVDDLQTVSKFSAFGAGFAFVFATCEVILLFRTAKSGRNRSRHH